MIGLNSIAGWTGVLGGPIVMGTHIAFLVGFHAWVRCLQAAAVVLNPLEWGY